MAKQSQLDKAIAVLKGERDILDLAIAKLEAQQPTKAATKPNGRTRTRSRKPVNDDAVLDSVGGSER